MKKKIALENYPTSAGMVKKVPHTTATLNGVPIATLDSVLVHNSIGADAPIEFTDGVLLNDSPLTFVDAKTAGGAIIQDAGLATATIEGPTQVVLPDEPEQIIKSKTVKLESTYAMEQVQELAEEWAGSTFYLFLKLFFNDTIPVKAYQDLYKDMSNKKLLNPKIEVVKRATNLIASFPDHKKEKIAEPIIRINEKWIRQAVEGDKNADDKEESIALAKSKLLSGLLEEYGHYLDNLLRFTYSKVEGDTKGDEGATYKKYFLINFNFLKDKKLHFADAYIDGAKTELILDFTEFQQEFQNLNKELDGEEFFSAGEGNLLLEQYGHFGLEKKALGGNKGKDVILDEKELSHLYIGNYMRDMSQLINPMFNYLTPEEKSKVESINPDATFLDGFGLSMLSRKGLTRVVELLAASEMRKITEDNSNPKPIGGPARGWVEPKKTGLSDSKVKEIIEGTLTNLGLKAAQVALDYRLFVKHYKRIDQEELGVYRPEEHIDSPLGVTVFDGIKNDLYFCNMDAKPAIGDVFGMKMHIRNHNPGDQSIDKKIEKIEKLSKGTGKYANGLTTSVAEMESQFIKFYQKYTSAGGDKRKQNDALRYLGNGLHIIEDFFAHTNFCEISIIKAGIAVHPWVDFQDDELVNYKNSGKRFKVKNSLEQKKSYDDKYSFKGTEEEIENHYKKAENDTKITYTKLDDFDGAGYYFSINNSKTTTTYFAKRDAKNTNGELVYDAHLAVGTVLSYSGVNYAEQIPLVSSYFSILDTVHSLVHVLQGTLKPKEITLTGILSDNEFGGKYGKLVLDLSDMIILHMLNDLAQSQKERNKTGKETGKELDYSKILKYYIELIKYRGMLFSIIANLSKKNVLYAFIADIIIRTINTLYVTIVNLVKSILVDIMELVAIGIAAYQNTELPREVGTNPSHSQLAKDHHEHPLHTLAANLAMMAVKDVGQVLKKLKDESKSGNYTVLSDDFVKIAKKYMVHPSQSDWMDIETRTWLNAHGAEIGVLEKIEASRKMMKATGEFITDTLAKLKKEYADFKIAVRVAIIVIENYIEEIAKKIEELIELANELTDELKRKYRKIIKKLEEDFENFKLRTQNIIEQNLENAKEQLQIQINKFNKNLEQKLNKAEELFDKAGKNFDSLKKSLDHYYKELMPDIFGSKIKQSKLQNNILQYMEAYEHNDYAILQRGKNNIKNQIEIAMQYISISPENYLAQLDALEENKTVA